jgi:hypothetical protein
MKKTVSVMDLDSYLLPEWRVLYVHHNKQGAQVTLENINEPSLSGQIHRAAAELESERALERVKEDGLTDLRPQPRPREVGEGAGAGSPIDSPDYADLAGVVSDFRTARDHFSNAAKSLGEAADGLSRYLSRRGH